MKTDETYVTSLTEKRSAQNPPIVFQQRGVTGV